jgi:feruloyl esterase
MKSIAVLFSLASCVVAVAPALNCSVDSIASLLAENSTVSYVGHYEKRSNFTAPTSLNYGISPALATIFLVPVDACVAQANISLRNNSQHSIGILLPDDWNERFAVAGSIGWQAILNLMCYDFASVSSDLGP